MTGVRADARCLTSRKAIIAEMVATTRSRVNAFLGKFKKLGFIEENSGVLRVNPARLHDVHSEARHWRLTG